MDLDNDGSADLDGSRVHHNAFSLGSMISTISLAIDTTNASASLTAGGGVILELLLDSEFFGPVIEGGLSGANPLLIPNSSFYNNFIRDFQNIIDAGDPIMFGARAAQNLPIHYMYVEGDGTVPNSSQNRLTQTMDATDVTAPGPNIDPAGWTGRVCFTSGVHSSLIDPTADPAVTAEMQAQTVVFAAGFPAGPLPGNGQTIFIQDPTIIGDFSAGDCQAPDRQRGNTQ